MKELAAGYVYKETITAGSPNLYPSSGKFRIQLREKRLPSSPVKADLSSDKGTIRRIDGNSLEITIPGSMTIGMTNMRSVWGDVVLDDNPDQYLGPQFEIPVVTPITQPEVTGAPQWPQDPVVTGVAQVGRTLSVSGSPLGGSVSAYQWLRGGSAIGGAQASSYTLTSADEGTYITARLTALSDGGSSTAVSNQVGPVAASATVDPAPSWSAQPTISGTPTVGQTLTGGSGTVVNGTVSSRQWLRNGAAISGATGATYLLVSADEGTQITFRVTATGTGGTASATSSQVGPVQAAAVTPAPVFTTQPSISPGSGTAGTTSFTASNGTASNATSYSRRWLLNGTSISTAAMVIPQTAGSLVLEVTATGPGGSTVATSAAVTVGAGTGNPGSPSGTIAGLTIGDAGDASYSSSYVLAGGKDYADGDLDLLFSGNLGGRTMPTRGVYLTDGAGNNPRTSDGLGGFDTYPGDTGWYDLNEGDTLASLNDTIAIQDNWMVLRQRVASTEERDKIMNQSQRKQLLSAMIHTAASDRFDPPCILEWKERRFSSTKSHQTVWLMNVLQSMTGGEWDLEANSSSQNTGDGRAVKFSVNLWEDGTRPGGDGGGGNFGNIPATYNELEHTCAFEFTETGTVNLYIDDSLFGSCATTASKAKVAVGSLFALFSNHVYQVSASEEVALGGGTLDIRWWRIFNKPTGKRFIPQVSSPQVTAAVGQAGSYTLPSQQSVFGTTGEIEVVEAVMLDANEPGGANTNTDRWDKLPPWMTYDAGTRTLSWTAPNKPGRLHVLYYLRSPAPRGSYCQPYHINFDVRPVWTANAPASLTFSTSADTAINVWTWLEAGTLFSGENGIKAKRVQWTGLPAGIVADSLGNLSGRPTGTGSGTATATGYNSVGQTTASRSFPWGIGAGGTGTTSITGGVNSLAVASLAPTTALVATGGTNSIAITGA